MKPISLLSHATQELRVVVLSLFVSALSACGGDGSNAEPVTVVNQAASAPSGASQASTDPIPVSWPAPTGGSARVFDYASAAAPASDYTRTSRFVLYDNGTFELQLVDPSSGKIVVNSGRYVEVSGVVNLDWDGSSNAGPWGATGTVDGTSLTVQYNSIMELSGFEDAVYVLAP